MPKSKTTGGRKLAVFLRKAKRAESKSSGVSVGFFPSSRYPSGTQVAGAAAAHEFGQAGLPEQPFFRGAIAGTTRQMRATLRAGIDPKTMVLDESVARRVGEVLADGVRRNIKSEPAPLVDTGQMLNSVDVKVRPAGSE